MISAMLATLALMLSPANPCAVAVSYPASATAGDACHAKMSAEIDRGTFRIGGDR